MSISGPTISITVCYVNFFVPAFVLDILDLCYRIAGITIGLQEEPASTPADQSIFLVRLGYLSFGSMKHPTKRYRASLKVTINETFKLTNSS